MRLKLLRTCHGASEDLTAVGSLASGLRLSLGAILSIGQEEWRTAWTVCRCGAITGIDNFAEDFVLRLFPPGAAAFCVRHNTRRLPLPGSCACPGLLCTRFRIPKASVMHWI